ncbi:MAG: DUF523 and DUF1722 domain-containing protein [Pseudomonadales bacterium]|nr:DUF523 and DUF1722 domain-containing protein [Pseudomonadales bacterium]
MPEQETTNKILVGISSCLLGEEVRYDGQHQRDNYIVHTLARYFEFRSFCPEVAIGLGIPRPTIRLLEKEDKIICVSSKDDSLDYTQALSDVAEQQKNWHQQLCGYILKKSSPSCGMERVKVYRKSRASRDGTGIYAARLIQNFPELPVEEEGRLGDAVLRENFIQRVYVMHRWRQLLADGLSVNALLTFHARHKLIIMSHCQKTYRELGPLVAGARKDNVAAVAAEYFPKLMTALKKRASRGDHVNVLQHIQGYLRTALDSEDRVELTEAISNYRKGQVPLIVPITLLNHHFRRNPDPYIRDSWYMSPYPAEMSLQNTL